MAALLAGALAACQGGPEGAGTSDSTRPYDGIAAGETISVLGTEPFWNATIDGSTMTYATPENQGGTSIPVERFAGNSGVSFAGRMADEAVDIAITPGACSDGMSDRTFPFVATVAIGAQSLRGCAYTDRQPFTGPEQP